MALRGLDAARGMKAASVVWLPVLVLLTALSSQHFPGHGGKGNWRGDEDPSEQSH